MNWHGHWPTCSSALYTNRTASSCRKTPSPSHTANLFGLGSARLGALASRTGNVVLGNPARVDAAGSSSGGIGNLGFDLLADLAGSAGSLLGRREEGLDPGLVDEVESTGESGTKDEVEEDAKNGSVHEVSPLSVRRAAASKSAYIWGSRKLVGASTMVAVPL